MRETFVFFGTPEYVLPVIESLNKAFKPRSGESPIIAVVTQEPKPVGRKKFLTYSAVDTWAHKRKIPVYYDISKLLEDNITADLGVLASYGEIIPKEAIKHFPKGIVNIHPSLLPKYRGSSPVQATIIADDFDAGSSIMLLDPLLDHGPIISQFTEEVYKDDTTESLRNRLFIRSAEVLVSLIPSFMAGKIKLKEQDHDLATFTREIKKEHSFIPPKYLKLALNGKKSKDAWIIPFIKDFSIQPDASSLDRFIRAMLPWPLAWTQVQLSAKDKEQSAKRLLIHKAHIENEKLVLDEVQLEGKAKVSWKQFTEGYPKARLG